MTPQDWEDMGILKDAAANIVLCLKELTSGKCNVCQNRRF